MRDKRNAYRVLVRKSERRRTLGRHRGRWEDSVKMDLKEKGWDGVDWISRPQDSDKWHAVVRSHKFKICMCILF
jgi:hypothetical protein